MQKCVEGEGRKALTVSFVTLQDVFVEGVDVPVNDECGADDLEAGVPEGGGDVSETKVFKR